MSDSFAWCDRISVIFLKCRNIQLVPNVTVSKCKQFSSSDSSSTMTWKSEPIWAYANPGTREGNSLSLYTFNGIFFGFIDVFYRGVRYRLALDFEGKPSMNTADVIKMGRRVFALMYVSVYNALKNVFAIAVRPYTSLYLRAKHTEAHIKVHRKPGERVNFSTLFLLYTLSLPSLNHTPTQHIHTLYSFVLRLFSDLGVFTCIRSFSAPLHFFERLKHLVNI